MSSSPLTDLLWTVYGDCIVTRDVKGALEDSGLSGLSFNAVHAFSTAGFECGFELYELVPLGWGGLFHETSEFVLSEYCPVCGNAVFSQIGAGCIHFDFDAWDGSDLCRLWPLPALKCVSDDFLQIVAERRWSGTTFTQVEKWRPNLSGMIGPGPVTQWIEGAAGLTLERKVREELYRRYPDKVKQ